MSATAEADIRTTIQKYFDGMYRGDTDLLAEAFDPAATVCGYGGDGSLKTLSLAQFLGFVRSVPKPVEKGEAFDMEVLTLDIVGTVAAAKVRDLYQGRDFTDLLHLIRRPDGQWRIFGKVFHSVAR